MPINFTQQGVTLIYDKIVHQCLGELLSPMLCELLWTITLCNDCQEFLQLGSKAKIAHETKLKLYLLVQQLADIWSTMHTHLIRSSLWSGSCGMLISPKTCRWQSRTIGFFSGWFKQGHHRWQCDRATNLMLRRSFDVLWFCLNFSRNQLSVGVSATYKMWLLEKEGYQRRFHHCTSWTNALETMLWQWH